MRPLSKCPLCGATLTGRSEHDAAELPGSELSVAHSALWQSCPDPKCGFAAETRTRLSYRLNGLSPEDRQHRARILAEL